MKIVPESENNDAIIDISSLIDIMFILIIFFLVTMTFHEEEHDITVNLPSSERTLTAAVKTVVINIRETGIYYLGSRKLDLNEIQQELSKLLDSRPNQKVLIRADQNARHGHVAQAIAMCKKAGIRDANIGYMTSNIK